MSSDFFFGPQIQDEIAEMPLALCWVDSFGNIKTNALPEDAGFDEGIYIYSICIYICYMLYVYVYI